MKWLYLPFMFALAFLYTKISYNEFQIKNEQKNNRITRRPSSVYGTNFKDNSSYKLSKEFFYKTLSTEDSILFKNVAFYRGTIVGNVQVDSFGYIIDDRKKINFGINDFSEVTEGALFHDVLSHLVSSKSLDKRISWLDYFEAYKKGLKGGSHTFSFYIEKGIDNAFLDSDDHLSQNVTLDYPLVFKRQEKKYGKVDVAKKMIIQKKMMKLFPKIQFFDLVSMQNKYMTYQALVRLKPQDKIQWLKLKEDERNNYDFIFNKNKEIDFEKRLKLLKSHVYSDQMDKSIFNIKIDNRNYVGKFNEQFISNIKWENIPFDDYYDIILDEAYVLGKIHAKSLNEKLDSYIKSWATIPAASIDDQGR